MVVGSSLELGVVFLYVCHNKHNIACLYITCVFISVFITHNNTCVFIQCYVFVWSVNVCVALHRNVLEDGLSRPLVLPDSHRHDSVLCVELADVDWDGQEEIVLGTFGKVSKQLCVYQFTQFSTQGHSGV